MPDEVGRAFLIRHDVAVGVDKRTIDAEPSEQIERPRRPAAGVLPEPLDPHTVPRHRGIGRVERG